ncbi:MAG: M14 family metallopeptidase [Hespellia sp.]|nr:M14 family metallopeptidase [Hespellia sp.]
MKKETIYAIPSPYREDLKITGYRFGSGKKSACIVGAIRGNEMQQLYICSQLIQKLTELEEKGSIVTDHEILVIPSVEHHSMNIGKRFWSVDNTDINRMFPGYDQGETTQRIANGVFEQIKDYHYGIQFASFYLPGDFIPHVRMMETGRQSTSLANLFGLPYVVLRKTKPIDTTTLNYNWQMWNCNAFSIYSNKTDTINEESARQAVAAVLRFLMRMGIIRYNSHSGYIATIIEESNLAVVRTNAGGIYRRLKSAGEEVKMGDLLAEIIHPYEGYVISGILAPCNGIIFFSHEKPLVTENEIVYKIIKRLHE